MASTKQPLVLLNQLGGVDSTNAGHVVADEAWMQHHNMRPYNGVLEQVPRKVLLGTLQSCYEHPIIELCNIPSGRLDQGHLVALSARHAWQVRSPISTSQQLLDVTGPLLFEYDSEYRRWGTTQYNGQLFFTNELNPIHVTDGTTVRILGADCPKARYITHYFDHLVVGWVSLDGMVMPGRVHWSHLYGPSQWRPARGNESDHYDFEEDVKGHSSLRGVTGFTKLGDTLFVVTPHSVRPMKYVGLPKVFRVGDDLTGGIGSSLPWGSITVNNAFYFFDAHESNFFKLSLNGIQPFGEAIQGYLQGYANTDPRLWRRTWCYYQPEFTEITWVFCSTVSTGTFDLGVTYNIRTGKWFTRSVEDLHSFGGQIRQAKSVGLLTGQAGALTGSVEQLGEAMTVIDRCWGGANGWLFREEKTTDALSTLVEQEAPTLETKDYVYEAPHEVKEIDTLTINSSYTEAKGVAVSGAARDFLGETVTYKQPKIWVPHVSSKLLSDFSIAGRVLRLKMQPVTSGSASATTTNCDAPETPVHGSLYVDLEGESTYPPFDSVIVGATDDYYLGSDDAPVELQYPYGYDANPSDNPYIIPQSEGMLADCQTRAIARLSALGYDGFTQAGWLYSAVPEEVWLHVAWPNGWQDGASTVVMSGGWFPTVHGFNLADNPGLTGMTVSTNESTSSVAGEAAAEYTMTIRVRAVVPPGEFTGGVSIGTNTHLGGTPASTSSELLTLQIGALTYYLNKGTAGDYPVAFDYTFEADGVGGASLVLTLDNQNGTHRFLDSSGRSIKVAGFTPVPKLWARIDYELRPLFGAGRVVTLNRGGGVRNWKWQGYVQHVYSKGAEL